jgi:3-isopropylmalate/(R)-2-methylmalate dehydratase small subunit
MKEFNTFTGIVVPLDRANVDTDTIIPKQYLKSIKRTGFGVNLFDDWRYLDPGNPGDDHTKRRLNTEFILNDPRYQGAEILLTRKNFGCGSSREHAVWALMDYGIRAVLSPGYADIFTSNAYKNGFLPVVLPETVIDKLFHNTFSEERYTLTINLQDQTITDVHQDIIEFEIDAGHKDRLLKGMDEISTTLTHADSISAYENQRAKTAPWLFQEKR